MHIFKPKIYILKLIYTPFLYVTDLNIWVRHTKDKFVDISHFPVNQ